MDNLENRAKLFQKKSKAREELQSMPIIKDGHNNNSNYDFISEKNYKDILSKLLLHHKLELNSRVIDIVRFTGNGKMTIGASVLMEFELIDIDTGYGEISSSAGDGVDSGDKAIYKAQTGAYKYFVANNFLVTTGQDSEFSSADEIDKPKTDIKKETASDYTEEKQEPINYKSKLSETKRKNLIETVSAGAKIWKKTESILKQAKVESIDKLTDEQLLKTSAWLNEMGDKEV